ncbi:SMI1/KNR4 family protein [Clostridium sp. P21]|uniref:SMI1/KNR4 family protein n=1 Tax=Clostridium muellerianum TaxID=2716538 RepID=A0A7Y0EFU0_9CLOT|nr:SMI1/KNR4 family protein [Clostridium muellerianum]NMM62709.1 SMI1/KNR4 family protein [Clostridium muellerianum]
MSKTELMCKTGGIEKIEKYFEIKFSSTYKDVIFKIEQSYPEVIDYKVDIPGYGIINFNFQRLLEEEFINFTKSFSDRIVDTKRIIPFASNLNGDVLLFDYIENTDEPAILYMEHEEALCIEDITPSQLKAKSLEEWIEGNFIFVSTSFEKFKDMIYI